MIARIIQDPPRQWNDEKKANLFFNVQERYNKLRVPVPNEVGAALSLMDLLANNATLVRLLQRAGHRGTLSLEAAKEMLAGAETSAISYQNVATALLYMVIAQGGESYDPTIFVAALRQHRAGQRLDWQDVVKAFDKPSLRVTKTQFLGLYNALLPAAKEYENFDIQSLWGNEWENTMTQLSFVVAFLSCSPSELDATQIPRLRTAFSADDFADASEDIKAYAAKVASHPMVSLDATKALFTNIFNSQETYNHAQHLGIPETVINANTDIFVCAASAVAKPWAPLQEMALNQLFRPFFHKSLPNFGFVLHALWKHDKQWLAARLVESYNSDPTLLTLIFSHAQEHGWVDTLLMITNEFGLDFASYAHGQGLLDLDEWARGHLEVAPQQLAGAINTYLLFKAEDESAVQRDNPPQTVPLRVKTVYALLNIVQLGDLDDIILGETQKTCLQVYPRLINYGYKYDSVIDSNSDNGNALSDEADAKMQEQYKMMYSNEMDPRGMIERLQRLKDSEDPADQDLFACMIHGLFDEYNCFGEYPLEALATTAVLFGGIINFGVLSSRITLGVALFMVLNAVTQYGPEDSMYKFGLQALLHFINRLEEWPSFCDRLLRIPGLRGTEVYSKAEEVVRGQPEGEMRGSLRESELAPMTNGHADDFDSESLYQPFNSIHVDPPLRSSMYEEPDEDTSDKVMFVLNNVSKRNLDDKFKDLEDALEDRHHQWFAAYLVEDLAKSQPNFQTLYLQVLGLFDRKILWAEVLRETYVSLSRILNSESTMTSTNDRIYLKNLAGWLGLLTLARNQPILHRNLSFKDLLLEAYQSQRLLIAIPFTCKVLAQAKESKVFRPPQPWLMELIGFLMELYHFAELKLNLKFEIEVLCKDLGLDHKQLEPLSIFREIPLHTENELLQQYPTDTMDGFGDMHLISLSKRAPNERFSSQDVLKSLPDLGAMLHYPPSSGNISQAQLKNIFLEAAQRAITEIIAPVVERSVTIAAISTSQLVEKDFAMEPDSERLLSSAHNVVKALSGSLALVTCKEPLRMSISNNIRILASQSLHEPLPEGSILMFVNDNLDTVCKMVEDAAESQSKAEIDAQIEEHLERRRRHNEQRPNEPFNYPSVSRWAFFIPDPYRQEPGGLNPQQLAIYEDFGRQMRLPSANHTTSTSQDSQRQIQDVLGDAYVPNLPTPAETPAMPRQTIQQQQHMTMQTPQSSVNGFVDTPNIGERVMDMLTELQRAARESPEEHIHELGMAAPVREIFEQLVRIIESSVQKDNLAMGAGQRAMSLVYTDAKSRLEIEILIQFLNQLCVISVPTARQLVTFLTTIDDDRVFNAIVTVCLLKAALIDLHHVDNQVARAISQRRIIAVEFLGALMDDLVLGEHPGALRADFVLSFGALSQWVADEDDQNGDLAKEVMTRLQEPSRIADGMPSPPASEKQDQLEYVFEEWIRLQRPDVPERYLAAFIHQLHERKVISNREDFQAFLRVCIDMSVEAYEREETLSFGTLDHAYIQVDALAKLIISFVAYQEEKNGAVHVGKAKYFEAILCLVLLVVNHHHHTRQERFNPKVFFRLFSSVLCELYTARMHFMDAFQEMTMVFGRVLLALQPRFFPGFAFAWVTLICHRMFMPVLLRSADKTVSVDNCIAIEIVLTVKQGADMYVQILGALFRYLGEVVGSMEQSAVMQDFYRGAMRVLLMIQHDFPEFFTENHLYLNSSVPVHLIQFQNILNCVHPVSLQELPDPFTPGLKMNRLEQVRQTPHIRGDLDAILEDAGIKHIVDGIFNNKTISSEDIQAIINAIDVKAGPDTLVTNALILHIGNHATVASSVFSAAAAPAKLMEGLLQEARPKIGFQIISAMANQVRYPNSHTHYFSTALLHLFAVSDEDLQQQVARGLVERLMVARPHPWGLIVTILELVKNNSYNIWELGWMKAAPEVERMLLNVAHSSGLAQSPRQMI